jgi:hypothetical protein
MDELKASCPSCGTTFPIRYRRFSPRLSYLLLAPEKYDEETLTGLKQIEDLARKMRQMLQS